ncbi:glycosyltransferase, partial [Enterobacter cloacae]
RDAGFTGYVEYRQQRDVVITTLLTSQPDPQRGTRIVASPDMLSKWAASLRQCGRIALVDELLTAPTDVELYLVPDVKMNVYFRRWLHIWQHLREHPEYRF